VFQVSENEPIAFDMELETLKLETALMCQEKAMGFRVQLIAVDGDSAETVAREMGFTRTGRREEIPESPYVAARLPNGRTLIYVNDKAILPPKLLSKLSRTATVHLCTVNETTMTSSVGEWSGARERWSVVHDAQQGFQHLEISGEPPREFAAIRDRLSAEQTGVTDVDYLFEIPVELFVALGGLRYDADIEGDPEPWEILERKSDRDRY
jgi:hypothetical protein